MKTHAWVRIGTIVAATVGLLAVAGAPPARTESKDQVTAGSAVAPPFRLPTRDGRTVALDSLRGKVVLVDFWASWCVPCRKSFPWMVGVHERYAPRGLVVVAINLDKSREPAEAFLAKYPAPFVVAFDPAGKTAEAYAARGMPSSYLVGPNGTVLHSHVGFDDRKAKTLEAAIQEALPK